MCWGVRAADEARRAEEWVWVWVWVWEWCRAEPGQAPRHRGSVCRTAGGAEGTTTAATTSERWAADLVVVVEVCGGRDDEDGDGRARVRLPTSPPSRSLGRRLAGLGHMQCRAAMPRLDTGKMVGRGRSVGHAGWQVGSPSVQPSSWEAHPALHPYKLVQPCRRGTRLFFCRKTFVNPNSGPPSLLRTAHISCHSSRC
jgi:hypothetical protein